jgi:hypothetical protein
MSHFDLPLNLPHAGRICERLQHVLKRAPQNQSASAQWLVGEMQDLLFPYYGSEIWPEDATALEVAAKVAGLARQLVEEVQRQGFGEDRLGQCVRNLFECLSLGEEGARLSLLAGENPQSMQRP